MLGKEISKAESLPIAYLEQIIASLRRADLVNGTRGARGGYVLARPPNTITVSELIVALEGSLQLTDCPGGATCCDDASSCAVNELFATAQLTLTKIFDEVTLADLAERRSSLRVGSNIYYI